MGLPQVLLRRFDANAFIEAALRHRATASFFVPGMVTRLADALLQSGRTVVPPLRRLLYGGAPIALDDLTRAIERIGPVLVQLYGRFEGGWPLAVLGVEDHARIAAGDSTPARSCGRPVEGSSSEFDRCPASLRTAGSCGSAATPWSPSTPTPTAGAPSAMSPGWTRRATSTSVGGWTA
jgi:acyl-coenzyme A synthetase/AMP-(fatty) acid ligase